MKHVFIINPYANNGKIKDKLKDIYNICKSLNVDFEIFVSEYKESVMTTVERFKNEEYVVIYAVGGDGTINVVLNQLVGGKAYLGVLPLGSGNDFYRSLPDDLITSCNVMKVNDRYCINLFSVGIDAEICQNANKMKKIGLSGSQIYNASIFYTFLKHRDKLMKVTVDGFTCQDKMTLAAVFNGRYYGGGYELNPNGSVTSSCGDVFMLNSLSKPKMIEFFMQVKKGTHEKNEQLTKIDGQNILIETECPAVANIDGEILISDNFKIDAQASRIKVVKNSEIIRQLKRKDIIR